MKFHGTDAADEGDLCLLGTSKVEPGDIYPHISQIKAKSRESKLQFLQHHNWQPLVENIINGNLTML